jgi:hypothetical protein
MYQPGNIAINGMSAKAKIMSAAISMAAYQLSGEKSKMTANQSAKMA